MRAGQRERVGPAVRPRLLCVAQQAGAAGRVRRRVAGLASGGGMLEGRRPEVCRHVAIGAEHRRHRPVALRVARHAFAGKAHRARRGSRVAALADELLMLHADGDRMLEGRRPGAGIVAVGAHTAGIVRGRVAGLAGVRCSFTVVTAHAEGHRSGIDEGLAGDDPVDDAVVALDTERHRGVLPVREDDRGRRRGGSTRRRLGRRGGCGGGAGRDHGLGDEGSPAAVAPSGSTAAVRGRGHPDRIRRRSDVAQDDAVVGRAPRVAAALAAGRVGHVSGHRDRRLHLAG